MPVVASRELRNHTRQLLERVEGGEHVTITVNGRPVAVLRPLQSQAQWMPRREFVNHILAHQADAELKRDLADLAPGTTDDLSGP